MNLSNRLTFSLVSLVVLIALGLVFGVTSVMAHPHLDNPETPNEDESDPDHEAGDHPMATITLIPANADAFTDKSVDEDDAGQPVVQLLNSAGDAFAELRATDGTANPPIEQDSAGIFKLLIEFSKELTSGSSFADGDLTLTALGTSGASVGAALNAEAPTRVRYDHDNDDQTGEIDHPRRFEVTISVPATQYAELPITVFMSVNAAVVLSVSSVNPDTGETIPELGNPRSTPADAKFSIVTELPAEADSTGPKLLSISDTAAQLTDKSFPVMVKFDEALHETSLMTAAAANTVFTVTNGVITNVKTTDNIIDIMTF